MQFELAVFDMAGTTVHDPDLVVQALQEALAAVGAHPPLDELRALMGHTKPAAVQAVLMARQLPADAASVNRVHVDFVQRMLACYRRHPEVVPMPGAVQTLAWLREQGLKIALNTAFSQAIAACVIERFGWQRQGLIDAWISADQVAQGRPAPDMIHALMARLGIDDPQRVIKLGDTEVDIREGRAAGCGLVVALSTGAYRRESLQAAQPDAVLDSLTALPELLRRLAPAITAEPDPS